MATREHPGQECVPAVRFLLTRAQTLAVAERILRVHLAIAEELRRRDACGDGAGGASGGREPG